MKKIFIRVLHGKVVGFYPSRPAPFMYVAGDEGFMHVEDFAKLKYPSKKDRDVYMAAKGEYEEVEKLSFDVMSREAWAADM